jgi:hypothetical protein
MLKTKDIILHIDEVPIEWVYEHYLNLHEKLTGQDVKFKSIFNANDSKPSMFIYVARDTQTYKWKDFSSGKQGNHIELVKQLFGIDDVIEAHVKIKNDYYKYLSSGGKFESKEYIIPPKYKLKSYKIRNWTTSDADYWKQYMISSKLLEFYNVKPLSNFTIGREDNSSKFNVDGLGIYGFFKKDGSIYKIYRPLCKENKFFNVSNYVQGLEQLTFKKPYLIICSSLKDLMVLKKLNFKTIEYIAPNSESTIIKKSLIDELKSKYQNVCTLFDNDPAGIKGMLKYKEEYNLKPVHFKIEKDVADCMKVHGLKSTKELIYPVLLRALKQNKK